MDVVKRSVDALRGRIEIETARGEGTRFKLRLPLTLAVEADEVRNLAMLSAGAAKSTAELIEASVKNADEGLQLNQDVLRSLEEIKVQVRKVSEVMTEVAAASDQQSEGIEQINSAVEQMNHVTQGNAANSEQSAAAAEELSRQAGNMLSMVARFKLEEENAKLQIAQGEHPVLARKKKPEAGSTPSGRRAQADLEDAENELILSKF